MKIEVHSISKSFGAFAALNDVCVDIPSGQLVALLGPSGSGKTTLLRVIAGLEVPEAGQVLFGDEDVTERPVRERNVGFVFQHYALFQHMTVEQNIGFGLRVRGDGKAKVAARVRELLELMQLDGLANRLPAQLSGGQRQRVALARALATEPAVLLLDEPFGALDARVRQDLRRWLRRLHDEIPVTTVFVTHDQEEAFEVADRVVLLNHGRIEQAGSPDQIFDEPANAFVMDFIGHVNVLEGRVDDGVGRFGTLELPAHPDASEAGPAAAFIRSQDIVLASVPNGSPYVVGTVSHVRRVGLVVRVAVRVAGGRDELAVEVPHDDWLALGFSGGDRVVASVKRAQVFGAAGGAAP
jgi:sulfate transport system ATP-binding protein